MRVPVCTQRVEHFYYPPSVPVRWLLLSSSLALRQALQELDPDKVSAWLLAYGLGIGTCRNCSMLALLKAHPSAVPPSERSCPKPTGKSCAFSFLCRSSQQISAHNTSSTTGPAALGASTPLIHSHSHSHKSRCSPRQSGSLSSIPCLSPRRAATSLRSGSSSRAATNLCSAAAQGSPRQPPCMP